MKAGSYNIVINKMREQSKGCVVGKEKMAFYLFFWVVFLLPNVTYF